MRGKSAARRYSRMKFGKWIREAKGPAIALAAISVMAPFAPTIQLFRIAI